MEKQEGDDDDYRERTMDKVNREPSKDSDGKHKKTQRKKKLEPSPKWQNLGLEEYKEP